MKKIVENRQKSCKNLIKMSKNFKKQITNQKTIFKNGRKIDSKHK